MLCKILQSIIIFKRVLDCEDIFRIKMVVFGSYTLSNASNFAQLPYFMKLFFVSTPFYPKLDQNQITQLMAIAQNTHLTQEQLGQELVDWGKKQPPELQVLLKFIISFC